jgi:hypothetical protein
MCFQGVRGTLGAEYKKCPKVRVSSAAVSARRPGLAHQVAIETWLSHRRRRCRLFSFNRWPGRSGLQILAADQPIKIQIAELNFGQTCRQAHPPGTSTPRSATRAAKRLWHALATRGVRMARDTGELNLLFNAINYLAALNVHSGAFATAALMIDEVDALTQATGISPLKYASTMPAAARGDEWPALHEWNWRNLVERGEGSGVALWWLTALLHNGPGHYEEGGGYET